MPARKTKRRLPDQKKEKKDSEAKEKLLLQEQLLQGRETVLAELKKYPGVLNVGVGIKEKRGKLTPVLCYRVYVSQKKAQKSLRKSEIIPKEINGHPTDVIQLGQIEEIAADSTKYRPLKGGIQIKTDRFTEEDPRGVGTLGCLALLNDGSNKIVGLTNEHVVRLNAEETSVIGREVGQPRKVICCCCCTYNIVGKVLQAQKNASVDCAIVELDSDIITEIQNEGTLGDIQGIGKMTGKAVAVASDTVKKRGATTGLTTGTIVDVAFDGTQILISPNAPDTKFADFGDSGSIVVNSANSVIGLLWAVKRAGKTDGVATPIDAVLSALNIKLQTPPPVVANITVHPNDTKTHIIPSMLPPANNPRQHFVTAKGTGDIILKVNFDTPVANDKITWVSSAPDVDAALTFPAVGTDNSTAKISRNLANGLRTGVSVFVDGQPVKQASVWVVWSVGVATPRYPGSNIRVTFNPANTIIEGGFVFKYEIFPPEIIPASANDDVPNLTGANVNPPPDVPAGEAGVAQAGVDLSGGAVTKWDVTRRIKRHVLNPAGIVVPPGDVFFFSDFPNYPSSTLAGNDDKGVTDEDGDPYSDPDKGFIRSEDNVSRILGNALGATGNTLEIRNHFQEFARLELDGHWYNISDPLSWRIHLKFKKASEAADAIDYNADGDQTDTLWINDGSDITLDNTGF
jgi:hypothetical protein